MQTIKGIVERITYWDEESGYGVIQIHMENYLTPATLTGKFISVSIGSLIEAKGDFVINKKFGQQFNVKEYKESLPSTVFGIEKYLSSGMIDGIGPKFAKQIVNKFKEKTIDIIENNPMKLLEIPNIGVKRIEAIKESWSRNKNIKDLMMFLGECGVSVSLANKIYKTYGLDSINILKQNPYRISNDIYGVGFKLADKIAQKLGHSKESYSRCKAGFFHVLNKLAVEGNCYAHFEELIKKASDLLGASEEVLIMTFDSLKESKELIYQKTSKTIYLPLFYYSEIGIAKLIYKISKFKIPADRIKFKEIIKEVERENEINYDEAQLNAIEAAVYSKFSVITGGPGVGKTTITKAIIDVFDIMGKSVILAAPTGRAAKRMTETCEITSKTLHRLLEADHIGAFSRNEHNPLIGDVIIIDECSMIDTVLMYNLLKAIPADMKVIMIGDFNQLPSVGAGNVLSDIIDAAVVPVIKLNKIYRQAKSSKIITNSHKVNLGQMPDLSIKEGSDFFFINKSDPKNIISTIKDLCFKRLPNKYKVNSIFDIQVLSPMKRGLLGTENLNVELQDMLNSSKLFIKRGERKYKLGDKVMQIKNNYNKNVFNGDIGIINEIDLEELSLTVNFEGNFVEYDYSELEELVLSYAITIHKSQGGEFPIVVMPVHFQHKLMLQKNLLYTAITRAKKIIVLIGNFGALKYGVQNGSLESRKTSLKERLTERFRPNV